MNRVVHFYSTLVLSVSLALLPPVNANSKKLMNSSELQFTEKAMDGGVAVEAIEDPKTVTGGIVDATGNFENQDQLNAALQSQIQKQLQQHVQRQNQTQNQNMDVDVQTNTQSDGEHNVVVFQQGSPKITEELVVFNEEVIGDVIDDPSAENNSNSNGSGSGSNTQTNTVGDVTANLNISAAATAANESGPGSVVTFSASISNVQDSVLVNVGQFNLSLSGSASISNNSVEN